jgi:hypothetical protein
MDDVKIPAEPQPTGSSAIRTLTIVASGLTAASIAVNLALQIAHFARKRPMQPDQRDKVQAASLALSVTRQLPGLIKQARLFANQLKSA